MASRLRRPSKRVHAAWRLSGIATGAMTAFIGFGSTAHAETTLTPEDIAAVTALVDTLATGSMGSSGSSGSLGSSGADPAQAPLPEPVAGGVPPVPPVATDPAAGPVVPSPGTAPVPSPSAEFALPAFGVLTSEFGDGRNHQGIDIAGPTGRPIMAAAGGKVINAGPAQGFGLWVRIEHADGTITTYGHNDTNTVEVGDVVVAGQQIATIGNRGDSTGPHLHFEVKLPSGTNTDPLAWLNERGIELAEAPGDSPAEETVETAPVETAPVEAPPVDVQSPPIEVPAEVPPAPLTDPSIAV
jgi:hypothetical protein